MVSVIIPTKDSAKTLGRCLDSIQNQTYKNFEIIVVDNHSKDNTVQIVEKYCVRVYLWGTERSAQVNFGAKKARGKYIYRVDSDFILTPEVIESAVKKCEEEECGAVIIHNTSDPKIGFWAKVRKFERDFYRKDHINIAARFFRKDVFRRLGGFDESLTSCEDYDLHNRLVDAGIKIGRISEEEIHIGEPKSLGEVVRTHFYYGKSIKRFVKKHSNRSWKQLAPVRVAYLRNWKNFLNNPKLALGFLIYQIVRYMSALYAYIVY